MADRKAERERIGARIAQLREEQGLTQEQLAEKIGSFKQHISRIEEGKYGVRVDILQDIAEALGKNVDLV